MKALSIILITTFISICSIHAQENGSMTEYSDTEREIPLKDLQPGKPINRSIIPQFAYAYQYNKVISIDLTEMTGEVSIVITNLEVGTIVYSDYLEREAALGIIDVDLDIVASGSYIIDIINDESWFQGYFSL